MRGAKELILEAAEQMIAEQGVNNTSVQAIVERAGLSKGALYHHYKNKDMLLCDVVDHAIQRYKEPVLAHRSGDKFRLQDELYAAFPGVLNNETHNKLLFHMTHEAITGNTEVESRLAGMYRDRVQSVIDLLESLYDVPESRMSRAFAATLLGAFEGQVIQLLLKPNSVTSEDFLAVWEFLIRRGLPVMLAELNAAESER